ncbi:6-phosphogluconate dehydrogenase C-terminal domain-like protein [Thermothelomyces heterothallicus CBS 203.75]
MLVQQQQQLTASIVGAGPAGFALAAGLQSQGTSVLVYSHPTHLRHANQVRRNGLLRASGLMEGSTRVRVTTDMAEAVAFSRIMFLTVPSTGQETVLEELRKFPLRQHAIVAVPGNLFSLIAADLDAGCILETNLSPYSCRMEGDGELRVLGKKELVFIAALQPKEGEDEDGDVVRRALCGEVARILSPTRLKWCSSVVEVSLANVNGVFHPLMMLMNAGRIESTGGDFMLYADGLTPSVANAMAAVDRVRIRIGEALGLRLDGAVAVSNECYGQGFPNFVDLARHSPPHNRLRAPPTLENRNLSEDVPDLLVSWCGLAEKLGIDASPIRAVITLAQMATGVDYLATGRNLRRLGLEHVTRAELITRFGGVAKRKRAAIGGGGGGGSSSSSSKNNTVEACRL